MTTATMTPQPTRRTRQAVLRTLPTQRQRALNRLLLGLWRALDACTAFTRTHGPADGDLRQALERTSEEYDRWHVQTEMSAARYLLALFVSILAGFTSERRPSRFPVLAVRDCGPNDRQHVAAILALRAALEAAYGVLETGLDPADPLAQHLTGMLAYVGMLESLLSCQAIWCQALDGDPAPRPRTPAAAA